MKEKGNRTKCTSNLRVMPATGELLLQEEDLVVPGRGLDFVWARTYRSRTGTNTAMGQGWSHSYDIRAVWEPNSDAVRVFDGTPLRDVRVLGSNATARPQSPRPAMTLSAFESAVASEVARQAARRP